MANTLSDVRSATIPSEAHTVPQMIDHPILIAIAAFVLIGLIWFAWRMSSKRP